MTRMLDHLVLPVASLATARSRLTGLGFTVAPDGRHPFGTANCCVYFNDGTFIEPLAVADPAQAAAAIRAGNVFVARDHVFRSMVGEEGMSAIVLATDNAGLDHDDFEDSGIGIGELLTFSRPFIDAAGNSDTATFRLAFAATPDAADAFAFSCERVNSPKADRKALAAHPNGALSISRVSIDPDAAAYIDMIAIASKTGRRGDTVSIGDTAISLAGDLDGGVARTITGVAFRVADLHIVENLLLRSKVDFLRGPVQIVVPPAPGQGVAFIFEADQ